MSTSDGYIYITGCFSPIIMKNMSSHPIFGYLRIFCCLLIISINAVSCVPPDYMIRRGGYGYSSNNIVRTAERYIGAKYKNGGSTPFGFDCSGFVMFVYQKNGIDLPREVTSQYYSGRGISLEDAKPGDLVFFQINSNRISHVGIYTGNNNFIHAPSSGKNVSYASIDNPYWEKRYIGAVSIIRK